MKRLFILILLFASQQSKAQNCIDTVRIKGYYVIKKRAVEIAPKITSNNGITTIENNIDTHVDPSFIPCDSITKERPLSYWLNHFFDDVTQVFISCQKFSVNSFISKDCLKEKKKIDSCLFPILKSNVLYQTTNLNTGDVFEIYYLDAYWGEIKVKAGSLEADMIPSKIAQRSISANVNEFNLYYFINIKNIEMHPKLKDPAIRIWKKN